MSLVAFKVANFITETREHLARQSLFKKQVEASLLHESLESQSTRKLMNLANSLFSNDSLGSPLQAVGYFVKKTEKYIR
jgi:hypothetical protein